MLHRVLLAMAAVWLGLAGPLGGAPAWAQASADQLNKLSLESLTAGGSGGGGGGGGYRAAPHHSYAGRHYARYAPRRGFVRYHPHGRYGRHYARYAPRHGFVRYRPPGRYGHHYARYAPQHGFVRHHPSSRYGRIAYVGRPHVYAGARRHPVHHQVRRYYR